MDLAPSLREHKIHIFFFYKKMESFQMHHYYLIKK
jgi:hypothetical protein